MSHQPPLPNHSADRVHRSMRRWVASLAMVVSGCIPVSSERRRPAHELDITVPAADGMLVRIEATDVLTPRAGWPKNSDTNGLAVQYRGAAIDCEIVGGHDGHLDPGDSIQFRIGVQNRHSPRLTYQLVRHDPLAGPVASADASTCRAVRRASPPGGPMGGGVLGFTGPASNDVTATLSARVDGSGVLPSPSSAEWSRWRQADVVVVAPGEWLSELDEWVAYRESQGHTVARLSAEALYGLGSFGNPNPEIIHQAIWRLHEHSRGRLKYVVLVGDVRSSYAPSAAGATPVPTFYGEKVHYPGYTSQSEYPTDSPYAVPPKASSNRPRLAVGRLPARDRAELRTMVEKVLRYERAPKTDEWQRRLVMFGGPANYGAVADRVVESQAEHVLNDLVPYDWDLRFVFAKPTSPYAYRLDALGRKLADELSAGALFAAYFGHGASDSFDWVSWRGEGWSIGDADELEAVSAAGRAPIFFSFTCDTGAFDHPDGRPSLAEVMASDRDGPVAVFASSRSSHPYPNALYARALVKTFLNERPETLGLGLLHMRQRMVQERIPLAELLVRTPVTKLLDEHLGLYALLGDPLLRVRYPDALRARVTPDSRSDLGDGLYSPSETIRVEADVPFDDGEVLVTVETERRVIRHPLVPYAKLTAAPLNKALKMMAENHERALDKVVSRTAVSVKEGHARTTIRLPKTPGTYYVKLFATGPDRSAATSTKLKVVRP